MIRSLSIVFALTGVASLQPAGAQQAEKPKAPTERPAPAPDFKVVFWFGRSDWKHQVYDVRKGQYTRAVDDWVNQVEVDPSGYVMPGRMATVRDVYLKNERGETEQEKLDAAIRREQAKILGVGPPAAPSRRYSTYRAGPLRPAEVPLRRSRPRLLPGGTAPGMRAYPALAPPAYSFPVPYPYPRPHP